MGLIKKVVIFRSNRRQLVHLFTFGPLASSLGQTANTMLTFLKNRRLVTLTRLFLGGILFGAGMSKLYVDHAFPGLIGPVWLEERLAEHGLALFARFVAFSQVLAGILLLTQRFATLGAIISFPLFLNILLVTISLEWRGTPYVNAVFLAMNSYLLLIDFPKLKFIFTDTTADQLPLVRVRKEPRKDILFLTALVLIFVSIPFSYVNLYAAWGLVALCLGVIAWIQLRKKTTPKETSSKVNRL